MADWLVTFEAELPKPQRDAVIRSAGASQLEGLEPVPLGSEVAVQVTADEDAVSALRARSEVIQVYPSSDLTLY